MTGYLGDAGAPNYTLQSPLLWTQLGTKLKQMQNYTFSLIPLSILSGQMEIDSVEETKGGDVVTTGVFNFTTEFHLAGKLVKILGYNPFQYSDVTTSGKYLSCTSTQPLQFTLQTEGYNMLYVHSNFGKSVSAAPSTLDNNYITPPIYSGPFKSSAVLPKRPIS